MFRLVHFREDSESERPIVEYLSPIVSQTILNGIAELFTTEGDYEAFYDLMDGDHFFEGIGQYYRSSDRRTGYEIFRRKLERMKEKLQDPNAYHTFDLLEERIFYEMIQQMAFYVEQDILNDTYPTVDSDKEKQVAVTMISKFDQEPEEAAMIAKQACRFYEMGLTEDEDDNLVFWDDDYLYFFGEGFIQGVKHMVGAEGDAAGYGYGYTKELFEDIGLKAPMLLIGSEEAHKLANEITMKRYMENLEKMAGTIDQLPEDDDLPFN